MPQCASGNQISGVRRPIRLHRDGFADFDSQEHKGHHHPERGGTCAAASVRPGRVPLGCG